jgi:hypothetical protein
MVVPESKQFCSDERPSAGLALIYGAHERQSVALTHQHSRSKNLLPVFKVRERRRRAIGITTQEIGCGIGFVTAIAFEAVPASPISSFQLS